MRYYNSDGSPAEVDGCYGISRTYNAYGNKETESWLDADGNPMVTAEGYATARYDYDLSESDTVERYYETYLDADGNPVQAANGSWGRNTLYYPVTLVHQITYVDENGEPVITSEGYAIYEYEEDEHGNRTWEAYYDEQYAPINTEEGYSSIEREYDGQGRVVSERYLDRYNKLINNTDGVAGWNGYYDENGELVITNQYDQNREAIELN